MKKVFDPGAATELKGRFSKLRPDTARQWGKMTAAQMVAHCSNSLEQALGDEKPPRMFLGHIFGGIAKRDVFSDKPMKRNTPTSPTLAIRDDRNLDVERKRLDALIDRAGSGPQACTDHPHIFFGQLTPDEWGKLIYKHLDHHLQQFGV
jgi:hypothetical protein